MKIAILFILFLYNFKFYHKKKSECLFKIFKDNDLIKRLVSLKEKDCLNDNYGFDFIYKKKFNFKNIIKSNNKEVKYNNTKYYKKLLKLNIKHYEDEFSIDNGDGKIYKLQRIDLLKTNFKEKDRNMVFIRNERLLESKYKGNKLSYKKILKIIKNNYQLFPICYQKLIKICLNESNQFNKIIKKIVNKKKSFYKNIINKKCIIGKNLGLICLKNKISKSKNNNFCPKYYTHLGLNYCVQKCPLEYKDIGKFCVKKININKYTAK